LICEYHVFIAVATNRVLPRGRGYFRRCRPEPVCLETFYRDYGEVNGVVMPFEIENRIAGQRAREVFLSTVRTDTPIADSDFQ
jgi:hypothetical protein